MFHVKHAVAPEPPAVAGDIFGDRLAAACAYATLLAGAGVERGLIGPREVPRLWERHILNSAVVAELIEHDARVVDIGSGAGLPGIPLALARPDLTITLVEPMQRRSEFLSEAVEVLEIGVDVLRGRAEEKPTRSELGEADVVTSRAVADLLKLARWSLPLLRPGGRMLALKGDRAESEVGEYGPAISRLGGKDIGVMRCGVDHLTQATTVVSVARTERGRRSSRMPERRGR